MTRNMSSILNLCFIVRKLGPLSINAVRPIRFIRTSSFCKEVWERDNKHEKYPSNNKKLAMVTNKDASLLSKIEESSTQNQVIEIISRYGENMNGFEAVRILTALFKLEKNKKKEKNDIATKKEFAMICEILKKNIRQLSNSQVIQALKVLNSYHVPTSTVIIQMLLQIIRNSINNLSLEQLIFMNFLIEKFQKTPLVEALSIAIPVVLESKITTELDSENIDILINLLDFFVRVPFSDTSVLKILDKLNNIVTSSMTLKQTKALLTIMSRMSHKDLQNVVELYKKCHEAILNSTDYIDEDILKVLVNTLNFKYITLQLYNETLFDTCAMAVISKDMGFLAAVELLNIFNKFAHTSNSLLDYVAAKCFEDKSISSKMSPKVIKILVYGLSYADYKPVFWDTLKELLLNDKLLVHRSFTLLKLSIYLASLDCFYSPLLVKTFTSEYQHLNFSQQKKILFCDKIVKIFYPSYDGPRLPDELIKSCQSFRSLQTFDYPLKMALENALGGSQYVISGVKSMIGCLIDHIVVMRKGGFPIAVNVSEENDLTTIEELKPPPNSQVILFIYISNIASSRNTQRLTGYWSLLIRTLKFVTNYTVIPIHYDMWEKLSETEQLRYISQAIRLKSDELSAFVNS